LKQYGFPATPAWSNLWTPRYNSIDAYLTMLVAGQPAFILSPRCKVLRKGFNSEYKWRKIQMMSEDRYSEKPTKNIYSHIHDAAQYAAMLARKGDQAIRANELFNRLPQQVAPNPSAWS
jgi:hypothetical protein